LPASLQNQTIRFRFFLVEFDDFVGTNATVLLN